MLSFYHYDTSYFYVLCQKRRAKSSIMLFWVALFMRHYTEYVRVRVNNGALAGAVDKSQFLVVVNDYYLLLFVF